MKKLALGDLGDFWYGDYKEPLVQLDGAVPGHPQGVVLKDDSGKILCAYCGKTYENLAAHVRLTHGMSAATYKEEVGLLRGAVLWGETTRQTLIRKTIANKGAARIQGKGGGARGLRVVPAPRTEALNKTGRCYAQTLAAAHVVVREHGSLSEKWLSRHGIRRATVAMHFGSMDNLARLIGTRRLTRSYSDDQLLTALRGLADELGATPSSSDLRRFGCPSEGTYRNHFGSYAAACERVGLRPTLRVLRGEVTDAGILAAYATTGSSTRAARSLRIGQDRVLAAMHRYGYPFPAQYNGPGRREWAADMAERLVA